MNNAEIQVQLAGQRRLHEWRDLGWWEGFGVGFGAAACVFGLLAYLFAVGRGVTP